MATVTTSFSSAANLELAYTAMNGGWDIGSAVGWGVAAFDFMSSPTRQAGATISTVSSSYVAGVFADGDRFSYWGTNLTGAPRTATQLDYAFVDRGVSVSLFGAITRAYDYAPQTGYINKVIVSSPTYGSITLLGYDDIAVAGPNSITNVSLNVNGAQISASGSFSTTTSIIGGYYQTTLSGSYDAVALTYAGQALQLSSVSIPVHFGFVTADAFLASVLSGNDTINGSSGNNDLTGYAGNDILNGGAGTDTAMYSGNHASYTLTKTSNGYTVRDNIFNRDGTDTLISIERLQFSDARIALDIDGNAGKVYRLYEAAFNRTPDKAGLAYWIWQADTGASFTHIASAFSGGIEFQNKYGNLNSNQFIEQLYLNILDRAGESAGLAYWQWQLNDGFQSREQVLYGFSESYENQIGVIGAIENGIDYTT